MPRTTSPALVLVLALLGFGIVTAAQSATATKKAEQPGKERLIALIEQRRSQIGDLDKAVGQLRSQLTDEQRRVSQVNHATATNTRAEATLAAQAGTSAIKGSGLRVKVSDADTIPDDAKDSEAYRISDLDLQLLVNALWGAGAEAVAINGNRIVATTSIRQAGETIVVNFRPLSPSYRIDAIGADATHFSRSDIAQRMRHWHTLFGLGFSTSRVDSMTLPAFAGRVGIDVATPKESS
ncbi:MAG TPA: DUF881 domain-containing protein [Acidimicrobiales bacterium]|nr:DUF881 domain-containing protein [Acidimicrobiales bacterium]